MTCQTGLFGCSIVGVHSTYGEQLWWSTTTSVGEACYIPKCLHLSSRVRWKPNSGINSSTAKLCLFLQLLVAFDPLPRNASYLSHLLPLQGITVISFLHHKSHSAEQRPLLSLSPRRLLPFLGIHNLVDSSDPVQVRALWYPHIHVALNQIEGKRESMHVYCAT